MHDYQVPILALFLAPICIPCVYADNTVVVAAQQTEVVVPPRSAMLELVNLPALSFKLRAAIQCRGEIESLTLSVADTFTTLGKDDIKELLSAETSLTVPARQLTLAASSDFCLRDDATSADALKVPALATVHASLRCINEEKTSVHFASAPLQVQLTCLRELDEDQVPPFDK